VNRAAGCLTFLAALAFGCRHGAPSATADAGAKPGVPAGAASPSTPAASAPGFDFIRSVDQCSFGQQGPVLDLGEAGLRIRGSVGEELSPEKLEREGASFAKLRERTFTVPFYLGADEERTLSALPTTIVLRLRGLAARGATVYVNGKPAGTFKLEKGDTKSVSVRAPNSLLVPGLNDVTLRFQTPPRMERELLAEVDWIHVTAGEPVANFAAPTVRDVVVDRALGATLQKSFGLRDQGYVRCMGFFPASGTLEFDLGAEGGGDVEVEARLLRDRLTPVILGRTTASARPAHARFPLSAQLASAGNGALGAIELAVVRAGKGTRALIGEPRIVEPPPTPVVRGDAMRGVVLVVFGTVESRSLVPFGGALAPLALGPLAREGTVFTNHRGSSTLPSAVLAAMLTGHGPRTLRLEDDNARLPAAVTTVADAVRQAGVVTALFTANPLTTAPFGFDRSWETYGFFGPDADPNGVRPFEEATAWLRGHKADRFLLVVHARGGHPPWLATPEQLKTMAPENYSGGLDPKHAAELLSKARKVPPQLRFTDADRSRAFALHAAAVNEQDRALSSLLAELRSNGREENTLVLVAGDVGVNSAQTVPFGDGEPPTEPLLATPLIAKGKGIFPPGASITSPTNDIDVAKTLLGALGLTPPASFEGIDLAAVAASPSTAVGRSLFATVLGRHALRWGTLVFEASDRRESLCDVALEPLCTTDVRPTHPLSALIMGRKLAQLRSAPTASDVSREPAVTDASIQAALRAWGR
jgi:hypothetical protein